MTGGSAVMCCGVRDDGTSAVSCSAGSFGGVCGSVDELFTRVAQRRGFRTPDIGRLFMQGSGGI